jgi:outer membrane protein OmpA-like peptidoglycan-associated protein
VSNFDKFEGQPPLGTEMSDLVVSTSLRDAKLDRDREIINLAKKLNQLRNLAELTERKAEALNDEGEKMDEYILSVKNDRQVATQLIDNLKEPYEAITSIVKDMAKEIGQLSRSKMNELRRMTKPPNLIKKTVELVCHLVKIESPNGAKYFNNETLPKLDWDRDCLPMLSSKNFLGDISTYRPSKLSSVEKLINLLKTQYLSQEEIEKMNLMTERKEENSGTSAKRSTLADSSAPARKETTEENGGLKLPSISTIKRTNETNVKTLLSSIAITNTQQRKNEHISLTPANLSVSKVSYSSKTTGSLLKWCIGQLRYSEVLGVHDESVLQKVEDAKANVERAIVAIEERSIKQKSIKEEVEELDEKAGTINHEIEIILKMLEKFNKEKLNEERAIVEKCEEEKASRRRKEIEKTVSKTKSVPTPPKPPITPSVSNTFSFSSPAIEHPTVLVPLVGSVSISKIPVTVTQQLAFEEGSTKLTTVALKSLDGVLNVMNECESKICIESKQTASESAGVSEARASAVRQYLTSNGINPARLRTNAFIENSARFARQDARGNVVKKLSKQVSFYIIQELRLGKFKDFSPHV